MDCTIAIDPGDTSGWAVFQGQHLTSYGNARGKNDLGWATLLQGLHPQPTTVVVELPQIYRPRFSKGDPNTLTPLILQCGGLKMIAALMAARFVALHPKEWKGQLPKHVSHQRILQKLTTPERRLLVGTIDHNAADAIGVGLHYLGRKII